MFCVPCSKYAASLLFSVKIINLSNFLWTKLLIIIMLATPNCSAGCTTDACVLIVVITVFCKVLKIHKVQSVDNKVQFTPKLYCMENKVHLFI